MKIFRGEDPIIHLNNGCSLLFNKAIEFELKVGGKYWNPFRFKLEWTRATDHAGIEFEIEIFGIDFSVVLHDIRHWNYDKNRWYNDPEEEKRDWEKLLWESPERLDDKLFKSCPVCGDKEFSRPGHEYNERCYYSIKCDRGLEVHNVNFETEEQLLEYWNDRNEER